MKCRGEYYTYSFVGHDPKSTMVAWQRASAKQVELGGGSRLSVWGPPSVGGPWHALAGGGE